MADIENDLREVVSRTTGHADAKNASVLKLKGDASNRSYYRVSAPSGPSHIVMVMPLDAKKSEEATKGEPPKELPFINVHRYLNDLAVRVPQIHRYEPERGLMVLEDLGDELFEHAQARSPQDRDRWYTTAVDTLARLRLRTEQKRDDGCLAFSRAFDADLYEWELNHFRAYGLEARAGVTLSGPELQQMLKLFRQLAEKLDAEPRGFTHRDYQSRNLMVVRGELVVIDFQDALLGPRQYDLVALLRDSYVQLDRPFIEKMLKRYVATYAAEGGAKLDEAAFIRTFDWLTVQRKLKDAGRFIFIDLVKKNPGFLPYVVPSLGYVREALERVPELAELRTLLAKHVAELR
jgi:aminoglycoside/choline kinase family phosphotransferase